MRYLGCLLVFLVGCNHPTEAVTLKQRAPQERIESPANLPDDPEAREGRCSQVRRDAYAIQSECERAASGDWRKWDNETVRYRVVLKTRLAAKEHSETQTTEPLVGRDLSIFESNARISLRHVLEPEEWQAFRKTRLVVAASRWLHERGIDLIFVAVPAMAEVYIEQFLDSTPADGVIAPQVRETFLELLEGDVEVVDTFRLMREVRNQSFLYLPCDHHWNQVGMRGAVQDVANRLCRYRFSREARKRSPLTKTTSGPYFLPPTADGKPWRPLALGSITETQFKAAIETLPRTMDYITSPDGSPVQDDPESPVMLIGNSFAMNFRELLIREANLRLRTRWGNGNTTEAFSEFLREPEVLDGIRVLVWVTSEDSLSLIRTLPAPIMEAARNTK